MGKKSGTRMERARKSAATKDILGSASNSSLVPRRWLKVFRQLIRLRGELVALQHAQNRDPIERRVDRTSHLADAGSEHYERDLAFARLSQEQDALYEIDQALERIRTGTYGICEVTGRPIGSRRLEAIPWTRFSRAAELELEQQGALTVPSRGS